MKIATTFTLLYVGLFLFSCMFELTSTTVIDLTKSDDLRHGMLQKQWLDPILETIDKNLDYVNPTTPFRQDHLVIEIDNSETKHILKKRYAHGCRSSCHRHRPWQNPNSRPLPNPYPSPMANPYLGPMANPYSSPMVNPYPGPWSNPYPSSWPNPIGISPFQPRYPR
jgi:hypothetical protein